jgi:hypothetical protein
MLSPFQQSQPKINVDNIHVDKPAPDMDNVHDRAEAPEPHQAREPANAALRQFVAAVKSPALPPPSDAFLRALEMSEAKTKARKSRRASGSSPRLRKGKSTE